MTAPTASPSAALNNALSNLRTAIENQPEPARTDLMAALTYLEPAIKQDLDLVAAQFLNRIPLFGAIADQVIQGAMNTALDEGLAQLTAAKAARIGGMMPAQDDARTLTSPKVTPWEIIAI